MARRVRAKIGGMYGTDAVTGKKLGGISHLRQSLSDILRTPLGSRVMRREYGSRLFSLIDAPMNRSTLLDLYAATAEAIARWEPRFRLMKVKAVSASPGKVELDLTGEYLPDGQTVTIDGLVVQ
ncbi:Lysozyme [compost metagenome]